ncbi:MAG: ABC transporter ATP-binding protein [Lachnospiraceae bacterium]|nr:ABC transporter ATP-binding protein [Lachnospiraceae bacterium]MBQ3513922.1 ABC transporter ATP-binding protein [Lachnospiraceae bacterium]MBQ6993083.1 ABC transporter ATP-binding protein [Lachnospiraceae bacterium]
METIIDIQNATKKVKEKNLIEDINLQIRKGSIVGIIGKNGSGKTVLLKCICGFMKLTSGKIDVRGKRIGGSAGLAEGIGILIENPGFLNGYSGYHNLKFLADIERKIGKTEIRQYMELVGLDPDSRKPVKHYSVGMRQRLAIAQAIMEEQDILILDEPMNGLDSVGVNDMRKIFLDLKQKGRTIILTSHIKEDIDILCDEVYVMDSGCMK